MLGKQNIRLVISLMLMVSGTLAYIFLSKKNSNTEVDKLMFQLPDWKIIDRVILNNGGRKIILHYNGSRWRVNDTWDADRNMIDVLFATLQQAEPVRPLSKSQDSLDLKKEGVVVQLFEHDQVRLSFHAGGNKSKSQAFFQKSDLDQPYIMRIPGYRVYVSGIFELDQSGWRDKYVFGFNWRNFQGLKTEFQDTENNFIVSQQEQFFGIDGLASVDTTRLNDYLDAVSLLTVDKYIAKSAINYDSLSKIKPLVSIKVTDISSREFSLDLLPTLPDEKEAIGIINKTEVAFFDKKKLRPLIRPRESFRRRN